MTAAPAQACAASTIAAVSSSTAPAWCAAASGIGTTRSRVAMPSANLQRGGGEQRVQRETGRARQAARRPASHSSSTAAAVAIASSTMVELHRRDILEPVQDERMQLGIARPAPARRPSAERCCRSSPARVPATNPPADDRQRDKHEHGFGGAPPAPARSPRTAVAVAAIEARPRSDAERDPQDRGIDRRAPAARWATSRYWLTSTRSASPLSTMYQPSSALAEAEQRECRRAAESEPRGSRRRTRNQMNGTAKATPISRPNNRCKYSQK